MQKSNFFLASALPTKVTGEWSLPVLTLIYIRVALVGMWYLAKISPPQWGTTWIGRKEMYSPISWSCMQCNDTLGWDYQQRSLLTYSWYTESPGGLKMGCSGTCYIWSKKHLALRGCSLKVFLLSCVSCLPSTGTSVQNSTTGKQTWMFSTRNSGEKLHACVGNKTFKEFQKMLKLKFKAPNSILLKLDLQFLS